MQKITDWSEYNKSLQGRGSITLWFSDEAIKAWTDWKRPETSKKGGRKGTYGDAAILCALTIRAVFNLPLRQTRGFIRSLIQVLKLDLSVPCFATISNRAKTLEVTLPTARKAGKIDLVLRRISFSRSVNFVTKAFSCFRTGEPPSDFNFIGVCAPYPA